MRHTNDETIALITARAASRAREALEAAEALKYLANVAGGPLENTELTTASLETIDLAWEALNKAGEHLAEARFILE